MDEIFINAIKDLPLTVIVMVIFYLLMRSIVKSMTDGKNSSDILMGRLIDLTAKFTTAVEGLKTTVDSVRTMLETLNTTTEALEHSIDERNIIINQQAKQVALLTEKVDELLQENKKQHDT